MSLSGRTIAALKRADITKPHTKTIGELLQTPGIGVAAVLEIANRIYAKGYDPAWPEFDPPPTPIAKCSHRVPVNQPCEKCMADVTIRTTHKD